MNNLVQINYFSRKEGCSKTLWGKENHILIGNYPEDYYITFDNINIPIENENYTISTKLYHKSEIHIKDIKNFIDKYLLSDGYIPNSIVRVRKSNNGVLDVLCTTTENCFVSCLGDIYQVDKESNIIENNYDIRYFSDEQDKLIAEYVWFRSSDILKPIDDEMIKKYNLNPLYRTEYFLVDFDNLTHNTVLYFISQNDDEIRCFTNEVSWINDLIKIIIKYSKYTFLHGILENDKHYISYPPIGITVYADTYDEAKKKIEEEFLSKISELTEIYRDLAADMIIIHEAEVPCIISNFIN